MAHSFRWSRAPSRSAMPSWLASKISRSARTIFPAGVAIAMLAYYLAWEYLVGFLNGVLDVD